jgi:hypothetical protein
MDKILKEFDEKFPCIQSNCDNNGTLTVGSFEEGAEAEQCQYCFENRLPYKEFLSQKLKEYARAEKIEMLKRFRDKWQSGYGKSTPMAEIVMNEIKELSEEKIK